MRSITKNHFRYYLFSALAFPGLLMLLTSCKKLFGPPDPMPTSFAYRPDISEYVAPVFVAQSRAVLSLSLTTSGNPTSVLLDYGTTLSYGNTKANRLTNTTAYGTTYTSFNLTGLSPGTKYHYRFTAQNDYGTTVGPDGSFTTLFEGSSGIIFNSQLTYGTLSDIAGNYYKTIQIGAQVWMAENLRATSFNDGTSIPNITNDSQWGKQTTPAYCWYDNDSVSYKLSNGALYNWFAVNSGKLCPTGWHVPTDLEWTTLIYYLGGNNLALGKLQETGTAHWTSMNPEATNSSGFTALATGARTGDVSRFFWNGLGSTGNWWSSSKYPVVDGLPVSSAWQLPLSYFKYGTTTVLLTFGSYTYGLSVRCLKD
jgi:uncharacterized protein (TIGR02145 family)